MAFRDDVLGRPRPDSLASFALPRRERFFPSPADWRDEVLYFLLPDRFSDAAEASRPLLDRSDLAAARPPSFRFDRWAQGGGERWQGGTLRGIVSKLDYLATLGVTCLWVGPVFKQRRHLVYEPLQYGVKLEFARHVLRGPQQCGLLTEAGLVLAEQPGYVQREPGLPGDRFGDGDL